jgi:hypothetical protein
MTIEKAKSTDTVSSGLVCSPKSGENALALGQFNFECIGVDGKVKWTDSVPNLVVNVGLAYMAGSALTSVTAITTWYIGLYGAGASNTPAAADTMSSHAGWTENVGYSNATRVSLHVRHSDNCKSVCSHELSFSRVVLHQCNFYSWWCVPDQW